MKRCADCRHRETGPLSGFGYCTFAGRWDFAHQLRQERAPCGPGAVWWDAHKDVEDKKDL